MLQSWKKLWIALTPKSSNSVFILNIEMPLCKENAEGAFPICSKATQIIEKAIQHKTESPFLSVSITAILLRQNRLRNSRCSCNTPVVGLSETYSKNYYIIREYVKNCPTTPVNTPPDASITDLSYDPNCIVKSIKQQQKVLTELEIRTIIHKYQSGVSANKLAEEFGCHRRTISDTLKRNGIEVSHEATAKPELVKRVIELYAEYKTPKEVGAIVGIGSDTVRKVLKDNGIYIRKSWEYPKE